MRGRWLGGLALVLSVALGGCLLPPPDTPPISPGAPQAPSGNAATRPGVPATAPVSNGASAANGQDAAATVAPQPGLLPSAGPSATPAPAEPGTLSGTLTGAGAIALDGPAGAAGPYVVGADGAFSLGAPAGVYQVTVTVNGQAYRLETSLEVPAGRVRHVRIAVSGQPPTATVSEEVPLSTPSPAPTRTP
jgi:hypothetical protein